MRIKRYLSLFLVVLVSVFALGLAKKDVNAVTVWDYHETFDASEATTSYADGSFTGVEGVVWYYGHSRNEGLKTSDDYHIDGKGIMLRRASDSYLEATFTNGIGSFIFNYRKAFTGGSVRQLEVIVNGIQVVTSDPFGSGSGEQATVYTLTHNINTAGPVTIRIKNVGNTTSNNQTVIDDFKWTDPETDITAPETDITATVNQLFGPSNETTVTNITDEYGQDVVVQVTESGNNEFQFALVNGVIRNDFVVGDNTLPITEGLDVSLVYATEETHAVLFLDSNGKLISKTWVDNGENVTAPVTTELSKPGYKLSKTPWLSNEGDTSLENITSSRVYRLQYELEETSKVNITVGDSTTEYNYNDIVTLTATNPNFKAWVDKEGNVLSTNKTFKFTALVDRTINESDVVPTTLPVVTMTNDLMLRETHQTFLGQLELSEGDTLVEYGLVASEDVLLSQEQLTLDNADKLSSKVLVPATNEFMLSIPNEYVVVRAFVTVRNANNEIETFYSDNQYNDVAFVMLAQEDLTIDSVATIDGLDLPLSGLHNTTITWISNNPAVITNDGDVTLPEEETTVTMTATIRLGSVELNKEFEVAVLPEGSDIEELLYETGFESSEGFSSSTSYKNGMNENNWIVTNGTVTTTAASSDDMHLQMRLYSGGSISARYNNDNVSHITKVTFNAFISNGGESLTVQFSTDGKTWSSGIKVNLTSEDKDYTVNSDLSNAIYVRWITEDANPQKDNKRYNLDDVKIYGLK